ncbi:MAG: EamA family transporter [Herbinix sp.]|jgi:drug/metabolite transporter (DMT)-like permease|nr:EamA family transporter [Herbinix sp.]
MYETKQHKSAKLALFGATLIWGGSFLIVKNSMEVMQPHALLAFRFTIGSLLLCAIFHKRLKELSKEYFIKGGALGIFLFLAYSMQTIGITDTTPGKNAFLTAIYVVIVPFLFWAIDKKKPDTYNVLAAFVSIIGIGFVSLNGDFSIRMGDALTLVGGVLYAVHIVAVAKFAKDKDVILLTIIQFAVAAILSWIVTLLFEDVPKPEMWGMESIIGLLYLAVFATAVALLLQNIGQKYTNPAPAAIILSLESVFGVVFSVIFMYEQLSARLFIGFCLIFFAVIISETKLNFLKPNKEMVMAPEDIN